MVSGTVRYDCLLIHYSNLWNHARVAKAQTVIVTTVY